MSSNIKIPKFCQHCGQAVVAQTTTTRFCGQKCASSAYKQRKREEMVQTTLSDQLNPLLLQIPKTCKVCKVCQSKQVIF